MKCLDCGAPIQQGVTQLAMWTRPAMQRERPLPAELQAESFCRACWVKRERAAEAERARSKID